MSHAALTGRQRSVVAAVVATGHVKGAAEQLGISESGAYRRLEYAQVRCGCGSLVELVFTHHHEIAGELDGGITPPTASAGTAGASAA